jgi:hypothetical protein
LGQDNQKKVGSFILLWKILRTDKQEQFVGYLLFKS